MIRFRRKAEIGIGAGGVRAIQWVGRRAGAYELQWKHCREWQGEGSVIGRFQASLIEKADPINVGYAKRTLFWSVSL